MIEAGKLIHAARFYEETYSQGFAGSGEKTLSLVKTIKCSVADVSYQNKLAGNKDVLDANLKMTTHYFKDFDINMLVKINGNEQLYKITYIENVDFKNRVLIFSLSKYEGTYD